MVVLIPINKKQVERKCHDNGMTVCDTAFYLIGER